MVMHRKVGKRLMQDTKRCNEEPNKSTIAVKSQFIEKQEKML
jgi:hypothetical protein